MTDQYHIQVSKTRKGFLSSEDPANNQEFPVPKTSLLQVYLWTDINMYTHLLEIHSPVNNPPNLSLSLL